MTDSSPRQLRVALIWFMSGASGAGLLVWAMIGSIHDGGAGYIISYYGFVFFLFVPSLLAGMVAALGAIAGMNLAPRYRPRSAPVWAGIGAFTAYGATVLAVMWFLTQGLFPFWVAAVSAFVLGLVAAAVVHLWRHSQAGQATESPSEDPTMNTETR
jgi:hypothetical protein